MAIKQVSLDGNWYYLKDGDTVPTGWLSLSGEKDRNGMDWLPFAFWDVKKGEESLATGDEIARYESRNAPMSRPTPDIAPKRNLPISDEILDESLGDVFDYTMHPKREQQMRYIVRFLKVQRRYVGYVQSCIKSGETPMTWDQFVAKEIADGREIG